MEPFKHAFINAYQPSKIECKVKLLRSHINPPSFLDDIMNSANNVLNTYESAMTVGI
jgi:hypothetical protein